MPAVLKARWPAIALIAACLAAALLLPVPPALGAEGELMQGADNILRFAMKLVAIALLVAGIMSIVRHHVVSAIIVILAGALLLGVGGDVSKLQRFGQAVFDLIFGG